MELQPPSSTDMILCSEICDCVSLPKNKSLPKKVIKSIFLEALSGSRHDDIKE